MKFFNYALLLLLLTGCTSLKQNSAFSVSRSEARAIGQRIFVNECAAKEENLIAWNKGEEFPSLGIGHFIWYPKGCTATFKESFPSMLSYMSHNGERPPRWVRLAKYAPWKSKADFEKQKNSYRTRQLRSYLARTKDLQTKFMIKRFYDDMPKMIRSAPSRDRARIQQNLIAVARSPYGMYPLIDYVNFKGAGIKPEECYNREGWGLRQVLEEMKPAAPGKRALNNFADAADKVLTRRIHNSPKSRGEIRWLPGWRNRINTYRK